MSNLTADSALDAVAIVGMAGRCPGARNVEEFWRNVRNAVESIVFFTDEELAAAGVEEALLRQPKYVRAKGILQDAELFDAEFFGYTPREAELMDPQQRIFLECTWEALEDAGYDPYRYQVPIGVFAGTSLNTYLLKHLNPKKLTFTSGLELLVSSDKDFLATRASYKLNLKGPSITIQTACSTSLVAVCQACQSLLTYQCDMALAGGSSVKVPRIQGYMYQEQGIASPDGHCRAFDAQAKGCVTGEGVGVVALKRLADALKDGDHIRAVIKGWAVNNDGSLKVGYTAPSVEGQAEVVAMAQALAGVDADTISYIETHGTGTELGDPIEIAALTQAFQATTSRKGFCAIASVKTNIGHLDAAAGVMGLIRAVLALEHRELPPSLHFESANPKIDFANSPFYVNAALSKWKGPAPHRAGVSSFGIGGTNAHVILEEAPAATTAASSRPQQLVLLSARSPEALETATRNLAESLKDRPGLGLADVAFTLSVGRRRFNHARMLVCRDIQDAVNALEHVDAGRAFTQEQQPLERPVAFMFPGQGNQHVNMGLDLYQSETSFRHLVDQCCEQLRPELACDLREVLYPREEDCETAAEQLMDTRLAQPSLFVIEYALARLWMEWGVQPQALIGHSIGEYVAACLAEVLSLRDALTLVAARGRLMQTVPVGAMTAVPLSPDKLGPMLGDGLSLAAINEPSMCIASGPTELVQQLETRLADDGVTCRRLHTSHAFHSAMMDSILPSFADIVKQIRLGPPRIPYISNVTGTWVTVQQATDPDYWVSHLRQTVRFADGVHELLKEPERLLLEVGPGTSLGALAHRHRDRKDAHVLISSMRHPREHRSDVACLFESVGRIWLSGVNIDWQSFYGYERRRRIPLPTYPFERQRYWIEAGDRQSVGDGAPEAGIRQKNPDMAAWFYVPSWKRHPAPAAIRPATLPAEALSWLVFADDCGLTDQLVARLRDRGHIVSIVKHGQEFSRNDDNTYTLSPSELTHYEAVFSALREENRFPNGVLHLWSVGDARNGGRGPAFSELLDRCFYSPLCIAQALGKNAHPDPVQLLIISDGVQAVTGQEPLCPEKSTVLGPSTVITQEYPNIACRNVDILLEEFEASDRLGLVDQLIAELDAKSSDAAVAYRGGYRWTRDFEAVQLQALEDVPMRLRNGGVYLITGGLGGIGLTIAEYLAKTVAAKLVLVGRTGLPSPDEWDEWLASHTEVDGTSRKIQRLQNLQALGAEVMVASADVSSREQTQEVVDRARRRFGAIHGVIHSAGIPGGGLIQLKAQEKAAAVLAPKVQGTHVLGEIFRGTPLDFMFLCSSLTAITGNMGQVDYTAANAFLDAFAHQRNASDSYTVSVNWDAWSDVGMAVDAELPAELAEQRRQTLENGIHSDEGAEVFARILCSALPQVIVSTHDIRSRVQAQTRTVSKPDQSHPEPTRTSRSGHARPRALAQAYVAPRNELEERIADVWQELFGIDQIGIHDSFFDLGGHSLLAIQIISRLTAELDIDLSVNAFFDAPTIAQLAEHVHEATQKRQRDAEKVADVLGTVEQLSEEEVHRLLAGKEMEN
jgi:acyl transferase domain-containing protein